MQTLGYNAMIGNNARMKGDNIKSKIKTREYNMKIKTMIGTLKIMGDIVKRH